MMKKEENQIFAQNLFFSGGCTIRVPGTHVDSVYDLYLRVFYPANMTELGAAVRVF